MDAKRGGQRPLEKRTGTCLKEKKKKKKKKKVFSFGNLKRFRTEKGGGAIFEGEKGRKGKEGQAC